jgi:hypothetical protein
MPFGSAFSVHNLGIPLEQLPVVYMATGVATILAGPFMGRVSDAVGKYATLVVGYGDPSRAWWAGGRLSP